MHNRRICFFLLRVLLFLYTSPSSLFPEQFYARFRGIAFLIYVKFVRFDTTRQKFSALCMCRFMLLPYLFIVMALTIAAAVSILLFYNDSKYSYSSGHRSYGRYWQIVCKTIGQTRFQHYFDQSYSS